MSPRRHRFPVPTRGTPPSGHQAGPAAPCARSDKLRRQHPWALFPVKPMPTLDPTPGAVSPHRAPVGSRAPAEASPAVYVRRPLGVRTAPRSSARLPPPPGRVPSARRGQLGAATPQHLAHSAPREQVAQPPRFPPGAGTSRRTPVAHPAAARRDTTRRGAADPGSARSGAGRRRAHDCRQPLCPGLGLLCPTTGNPAPTRVDSEGAGYRRPRRQPGTVGAPIPPARFTWNPCPGGPVWARPEPAPGFRGPGFPVKRRHPRDSRGVTAHHPNGPVEARPG